MKNLLLIFILPISINFISSCQNSEQDEDVIIQTTTEKIEDNTVIQPPSAAVIAPGEFIEYHPNGGIKMKGIYNDNLEREGLWMSFYDNGIKWSESYYSKGKLDGHSLTFYPNGKVRYVGEYRNNEKFGVWMFYDDSGKLTKEEKY